eukprot:s4566_g1.t1
MSVASLLLQDVLQVRILYDLPFETLEGARTEELLLQVSTRPPFPESVMKLVKAGLSNYLLYFKHGCGCRNGGDNSDAVRCIHRGLCAMNTGASEFLPREEAVATEGDDAPAPTQEEYVNSLLRLSAEGEERPAADSDGEGKGQDMDLQQRLNAAFQNSKESRKQGSATGPTEISLATAGLDWKPQYQGRLRSFVEQKGFGFIDCQETYSLYGRDVFVHRMQIQESGVIVGQHVYFDVELNNKGHPQARNIVAVNPHEAMQWGDPYNSWGYGNMSYGNYGGGCGFNGGYSYGGGGSGSGGGSNNRNTFEPPASDTLPQFEEELRKCNTEQAINDIIELYGQHFTKGHVVAALYQLGLCRQKPRNDSEPKNVGLAAALLERIMQIPSKTFAAEEASRVVWALAALDEEHRTELSLIGADALAGADAFRRRTGRRRRLGRRRRIVKTHWVAQMHCEDALDRRRRIAKTHWEDALG